MIIGYDNMYSNFINPPPTKKIKAKHQVIETNTILPCLNVGFRWKNNSCGFDSLFLIIRNILKTADTDRLIDSFRYNKYFCSLLNGMRLVEEGAVEKEIIISKISEAC